MSPSWARWSAGILTVSTIGAAGPVCAHGVERVRRELREQGFEQLEFQKTKPPFKLDACRDGERYHLHVDYYGKITEKTAIGPCGAREVSPQDATAPQRAAPTPGASNDTSACTNTANAEAAIPACTRLYESRDLNSQSKATAVGNRGAARKLLGQYEQAIDDFTLALALDPANPQHSCQRGEVLWRYQRYQDAIADYTSALQKQSNSICALRGRALAHLGNGNAQQALADSNEALRLEPKNVDLLLLRARASHVAQSYDAAIDGFSQVLTSPAQQTLLPSERAVILSERARAYLEKGRAVEAKADADAALLLAANNPLVVTVAGLVSEKEGRNQEAATYFKRALSIQPDIEIAQRGLERLNRPEGAPAGEPTGTSTAEKEASKAPAKELCSRYFANIGQTVQVPCE
jgi:tetratricopeptide (TPR) repeat protein